MLKLLSEEKIDVLDIELKVNKKLYAIDAFEMISREYNNSDNFFIMGEDNYEKINTWKSSEKLLKNYKYIIIERNNCNNFLEDNKIRLQNMNNNIYISNTKFKNVSSTEVRNKIKAGLDVKELLPSKVFKYIDINKLY